jgi:hypothetical protein
VRKASAPKYEPDFYDMHFVLHTEEVTKNGSCGQGVVANPRIERSGRETALVMGFGEIVPMNNVVDLSASAMYAALQSRMLPAEAAVASQLFLPTLALSVALHRARFPMAALPEAMLRMHAAMPPTPTAAMLQERWRLAQFVPTQSLACASHRAAAVEHTLPTSVRPDPARYDGQDSQRLAAWILYGGGGVQR